MEITSSEFIRSIGRYQDEAQRQPVIVTKRNRPHTVLISAEEYLRLRRRTRIAQHAADLSEAEMPMGLDHLNDELS